MEKRKEATINMGDAVIEVLNVFRALWMSKETFVAAHNDVVYCREKIGKYIGERSRDIKGYATEKQEVKYNLSDKYIDMSSAVLAYAATQKDNTLYEAYNFTKSFLQRVSGIELVNICENLITYLTENITVLEIYGTTEEKIKELRKLTNKFADLVQKPRLAITNRANAKAMLDDAVKEFVWLFKLRLDNEMRSYRVSHPEFYGQYKKARIIVDQQTRHISIIGNIIDTVTELPIQGVTITIEELKETAVSTRKGNYRFKHVDEGEYTIIFECPGYKPVTMKQAIVKGQRIALDIVMEKKLVKSL